MDIYIDIYRYRYTQRISTHLDALRLHLLFFWGNQRQFICRACGDGSKYLYGGLVE